MSNLVNLKQARKRKARADKRKAADENAARHGRSKADKALDRARRVKTATDHEAHKRDDT